MTAIVRSARMAVVAAVLAGTLAIGVGSAHAVPRGCPVDPAARPVLRLGARDDGPAGCVFVLEEFLALRYPELELKVDGKFVRATKEAVRLFQTHSTFAPFPTGVVDTATWLDIERRRIPVPHPFSERYPHVLVLGASNTVQARSAGLVEMLQLHGVAIERTDIDAIGGTTTSVGERPAVLRLRARVAAGERPDAIMIFTGINDVGWAKWIAPHILRIKDKELREQAYVATYEAMIRTFVDAVAELLGPVPLVWGTIARRETRNLLPSYFNEALRRVQADLADDADGSRPTLTLVDFASRMNRHQEEFGPDGTHLTTRGAVARLECLLHTFDEFDEFGSSTTIDCPDDDGA